MIKNLIEENIKNWRMKWINSLFEFSHIEYLKELWIEQKYENSIGWFEEDMCKYFDDLNLHNNYESQMEEGFITKSEFEIIKEFHFMLDEYYEKGKNEKEILRDKQWIKIIKTGNNAWEKLKRIITDKDESELIRNLERIL